MGDFRVCSKCGEEKPVTEFYKNKRVCNECEKKRKHLFYEKNKEKMLEQSRKYYQEHLEEITTYKKKWYTENHDKVAKSRANQREYSRRTEQKRRERLFELYGEIKTPCVKCGENRLVVIEFHHIDPSQKSFTISQQRNIEAAKEEAKKCVCLCANCHKEFHFLYGKQPKAPVESLEEYLGRRLIATV